MQTDFGQQRTIAAQPPEGLLARAAQQVQRFLCGLHGHDSLLHFEQHRISLQCSSCGYETPGWEVKGVPARTEAAPRRVRFPLLRVRRAA